MNTLMIFVALYLLISVALGLYAARRVKTASDYANAGRSLPLPVVIATVFATWFGSETVLGIPARFAEHGLVGVVEDPFGASLCLIFVGLFFARRLYRMNLLTIGDYYKQRYNRPVEIMVSLCIVASYLGWVSAQITAMGLVFNFLTNGAISLSAGMIIGSTIVLTYTLFGGMWAVALTDSFQMTLIIAGLLYIVWVIAGEAGGAGVVITHANQAGKLNFLPELTLPAILAFIGAAVTIMFGSIPQQDVFQRVMSANSEHAAKWGPVIGGVCYILFAFVPMFLVVSALIIMPERAATLMAEDPQKVLPTLVMEQMPFVMQVLFFGALLSAIKSCASATLLAPSVTFTENIWRQFRPFQNDRQELRAMRITVLAFSAVVLSYAIAMQGTSIYEMVSGAYQVPLVGAFVPLVFGLYWQRATTQGAIFSMVLGLLTWGLFLATPAGEEFPAQLAGLAAALVGMFGGSLGPQVLTNRHGQHHHLVGSAR